MMGLPGPFIVPGQESADTSFSVLGHQSPIYRSVIGAFHRVRRDRTVSWASPRDELVCISLIVANHFSTEGFISHEFLSRNRRKQRRLSCGASYGRPHLVQEFLKQQGWADTTCSLAEESQV